MTQEIQEKMLKSLMKRKKELEEEKRDFILNGMPKKKSDSFQGLS